MCLVASPAWPVIHCLKCQQGLLGPYIVVATMIFDSGTSDRLDNEQPAAQSRAAEWKSVAAGPSGVTSLPLTVRRECARMTCDR